MKRFLSGDADYVSNNNPPSYPDGLDTEIFSFEVLKQIWNEAKLMSDREHVSHYNWINIEKIRLVNIVSDVDCSSHRWTVDEPEELEFVRSMCTRLHHEGAPLYRMSDMLDLFSREPKLRDLNADFTRNDGCAKSISEG